MSDISTKLTYLNETKNLLKTQINYGLPTEEQITSSTTFREYVSSIFNAFLEALRTPDTLFTNLPKKSGSGANITLNDTANAPMRITLGSTALEQETTTGKNKLMLNDLSSTTVRGITYSTSNQVCTMSGTSETGGLNRTISNVSLTLQANQTYTITTIAEGTSTSTGTNISILLGNANKSNIITCKILPTDTGVNVVNYTPTEDISITTVNLYFGGAGLTCNMNVKVMLVNGTYTASTILPYEQYTGGIPAPNPSYPQDIHTISGSNTIKVEGKNLFDGTGWRLVQSGNGFPQSATGATIVSSNENNISFTVEYAYSGVESGFIKVKANETYMLSAKFTTPSNRFFITQYDENKTRISTLNTIVSPLQNTSFTTTNDGYIAVAFTNTTTSQTAFKIEDIMIEKGSTATSYTPYTLETAEVKLKSNNLLPNGATNKTISGVTFKVSDDGTITCSGTATANISYTISDKIKLDTGTYTLSGCPAGGSLNSYYLSIVLMGSFTFYADTGNGHTKTYDSFSYDNTNCTYRIYIASGTNTNGLIFKPMFNKGTTALPYDKYYDYGECGSIGNYENIPIRTFGKNLVDNANNQTGYYNGGTFTTDSNYKISDYIPVEVGKTYTGSIFDKNGTRLNNVVYNTFNSSKTYVGQITSANNYTIPDGVAYLRIRNYSGQSSYITSDNYYYQLELGSSSTSFEPYGNGKWYNKSNIGKVVLDGSETTSIGGDSFATMYANGYIVRVFEIANMLSSNNRGLTICNNFAVESNSSLWNATKSGIQCYLNTNKITISAPVSGIETDYGETLTVNNYTTAYTQYLAHIGTYFYYILATPTYTPITGTLAEQLENVYQKMLSQKGQTNISQVNNDLSFNLSVSAIESLD